MSATAPNRRPLDRLADRCWADPEQLRCVELVEIFRHTYGLQLAGVTAERLVRIHRVYARRLHELGPDAFDAECDHERRQ
jgi:hypothetical protein